jgi:hypothetical protein
MTSKWMMSAPARRRRYFLAQAGKVGGQNAGSDAEVVMAWAALKKKDALFYAAAPAPVFRRAVLAYGGDLRCNDSLAIYNRQDLLNALQENDGHL